MAQVKIDEYRGGYPVHLGEVSDSLIPLQRYLGNISDLKNLHHHVLTGGDLETVDTFLRDLNANIVALSIKVWVAIDTAEKENAKINLPD